jgi:hypothetical protein
MLSGFPISTYRIQISAAFPEVVWNVSHFVQANGSVAYIDSWHSRLLAYSSIIITFLYLAKRYKYTRAINLIISRHKESAKLLVWSGGKLVQKGDSNIMSHDRPPLWSSCQSFWVQIQRYGFDSRELPDFLRSSGSGTGSTQPREYKWGATWKTK